MQVNLLQRKWCVHRICKYHSRLSKVSLLSTFAYKTQALLLQPCLWLAVLCRMAVSTQSSCFLALLTVLMTDVHFCLSVLVVKTSLYLSRWYFTVFLKQSFLCRHDVPLSPWSITRSRSIRHVCSLLKTVNMPSYTILLPPVEARCRSISFHENGAFIESVNTCITVSEVSLLSTFAYKTQALQPCLWLAVCVEWRFSTHSSFLAFLTVLMTDVHFFLSVSVVKTSLISHADISQYSSSRVFM